MPYITYKWEPDTECGPCFHATLGIEADVSAYYPAQTYGPPESCSPAEGGEVEITEIEVIEIAAAFVDGNEVECPLFSKEICNDVVDLFNKELEKNDNLREEVEMRLFEATL